MQYTNSFRSTRVLMFLSLLLAANFALGQPLGLISPRDGERTFAKEQDLRIAPLSINISVVLKADGDTEAQARKHHAEQVDALSMQLLDASATIISGTDDQVKVSRQSGFSRLKLSGRKAESNFQIAVTSDKQLQNSIAILRQARDVTITGVQVIYPEIQSDEVFTTAATNEILIEMRAEKNEAGVQYRPRGFNQLSVESNEIGRDQLNELINGKRVSNWSPSEDRLTLVRIEKKINVALVAL